jgi:hypothetical protein
VNGTTNSSISSALHSHAGSSESNAHGPTRNPLWLGIWLLAVGAGIMTFLQVGLAAMSH